MQGAALPGDPTGRTLQPCGECGWLVCCSQCGEAAQAEAGESGVEQDNELGQGFVTLLRLVRKFTSDPNLAAMFSSVKYSERVRERNAGRYGAESDPALVAAVARLTQASPALVSSPVFSLVTQAATRPLIGQPMPELCVIQVEHAVAVLEQWGLPLGNGAVAVFPASTKLGHSCSPSTYFTTVPTSTGWALVLRAATALQPGQAVTVARVDTALPTQVGRHRKAWKELIRIGSGFSVAICF